MPSYLVQVSYTSEAVAALIATPQDRIQVVGKTVKKLGGKVIGGWMAFGEYDTITVIQLPDNVSAAAFALAISAGGSCKAVKTTPLISVDEAVEAFKKAGNTGYKPIAAS
jgi:uncharacterized protein with GYD domain